MNAPYTYLTIPTRTWRAHVRLHMRTIPEPYSWIQDR